MDYCHPCRRHLNGAVTCPGCGTPADVCRAHAESVAAQEAAENADVADSGVSEKPGPARGPRISRKERREQGARKAKRQRRRRNKVVLIGAGLALAAGGLVLAELGTDSSGAPGRHGSSATAEEAATRESTAASATGTPATEATTEASRSSASPSVSTSEKAKEHKKKGTAEPGAPADAGVDRATSAPATTPTRDSRGGTGTPPHRPTTKPHVPSPTPTKTCNRFLWWCS
ncbi:hypothetical protein [Streptomyces sp. NPDC046821]|uniref:SCO2400 family protein n=1 Tax=Streptomyces sp. NPDC046821 TaxID=3154702 RepID=UPI0033DD9414